MDENTRASKLTDTRCCIMFVQQVNCFLQRDTCGSRIDDLNNFAFYSRNKAAGDLMGTKLARKPSSSSNNWYQQIFFDGRGRAGEAMQRNLEKDAFTFPRFVPFLFSCILSSSLRFSSPITASFLLLTPLRLIPVLRSSSFLLESASLRLLSPIGVSY